MALQGPILFHRAMSNGYQGPPADHANFGAPADSEVVACQFVASRTSDEVCCRAAIGLQSGHRWRRFTRVRLRIMSDGHSEKSGRLRGRRDKSEPDKGTARVEGLPERQRAFSGQNYRSPSGWRSTTRVPLQIDHRAGSHRV